MQHRQKILYIFTRTPLHVGAGSSVGAIDQPIQRERHTGFPIIPASSLKGSFTDFWNDTLLLNDGKKTRIKASGEGSETVLQATEAAWLFGSDDASRSFGGSLQFSEAKLLAFPVRSAKGSFAWTTSPLILLRAIRDGVLEHARTTVKEPADNEVVVSSGSVVLLPTNQVVLEEYTFKKADGDAKEIAAALGGLLQGDPVWTNISERLVIVSDGMMSFYTRSACEIAQHVKINDETGTAEGGALFNQENVPSETLFYAVTTAIDSRVKGNEYSGKTATDALDAFAKKLSEVRTFQFGGDASTGLGYCTVELAD